MQQYELSGPWVLQVKRAQKSEARMKGPQSEGAARPGAPQLGKQSSDPCALSAHAGSTPLETLDLW